MVERPGGPPDALHRELARERLRNAHRTNLLRFWSVSAFFVLFLILGGVLRLPAWSGNLGLFAIYWLITTIVFMVSRRSNRIAYLSNLAMALFDAPMIFFLQWATFPTSNPSGVAGFTVGIYVLLVVLAALSLEGWYVAFTAVVTAVYEILLQHLAGVSVGAMASSAVLLGLAALTCSYTQYRLVALVERVDRDILEQRHAEAALRQAERTAALASVGREVSGTLDPTTVAKRTVDSIGRLLRATTAVLFRLDPASGALVTVATSGVMTRAFPPGVVVAAGAGAVGRAAAERRAIITPDVLTDPTMLVPQDLKDRIIESNHRAACAVPLIVRDTVIGVLGVGDIAGRAFTADDVDLAQAFAAHAALSIENARLYAELEAHLRQLETTQEQLLQAGKLAAVGQLVTGVAHEINNPLATIMGQAEMLTRRLTDPGQAQRVAKITESAMRAARIVLGLQTFIRPRPHELVALDLRALVERVLALREDAMRFNSITLIRDIPPSVPPVVGDAAQLEQVLLSLVLNAEQAVAGQAAPRIAVSVGTHDSRVRLSVADTGPGIPTDILPRIFEPFFTTKAPNQNAGLGLSTSYSIIQSHGGRLTAESPPGAGATFVVELPAKPGELAVPETELAPPKLPPGRVLVIDDEAHVAGMLHDLLQDFGMHVTVTADAEDAWLLLTTEDVRFDAITLDLRMSGLPGRALYERLERDLPSAAARVVFITGDIADHETNLFLERTGRPVLRKPFAARPLAMTLAAVLGTAEEPSATQ